MAASPEPPRKKRKLPSLDDDFTPPPRETDDAAFHQGRIRAHPHIKGQWACHVFIDLAPSPTLRKILSEAHTFVSESHEKGVVLSHLENESTLHISLSRPLLLQTNIWNDLKAGVARVAESFSGFHARYATFATLENDQKNRRFLGIELGTGWTELKEVLDSIDALLVKLRLPTYYPNPRFHTSISWSTITSASTLEKDKMMPFSDGELEALKKKWGKKLRSEELWVGEVCLKIGKDVVKFPLKK
ncbi:UPF0406 family protein [Pseudohyphozyma bogoriensis]|nr:UPF0406 family protein [Pseudohyphozyma bogoriensis]